jgi:hypothetical protein
MAETVMREDVPVHARPEDVSYDALNAIALDFWRSRAPAPPTQDAKDAKDAKDPKDDAPKEAKGSPGPSIPNYAAITGYDYLLFIPVEKVAEHNVKAVDEKSVGNGPIHLGVLATNQDLLEPALPAGAYFVAYRGAGEVPKKKEQPVGAEGEAVDSGNAALAATAQEPVVEVPDIVAELGFDPLKEHLIFYDNMGTAVLAMPTPQLGFGRLQPGRVSVDKVRFTPEQLEKNPKLVPGDVAVLDFVLRSNSASRGFEMNLRAKLRPGATEGWRY